MIKHISLGESRFTRSRGLKILIDNGQFLYAGNLKLKIYGTLSCSSGKRMKAENRVFFETDVEAIALGYRPCGHCMPHQYKYWKSQHVKYNC